MYNMCLETYIYIQKHHIMYTYIFIYIHTCMYALYTFMLGITIVGLFQNHIPDFSFGGSLICHMGSETVNGRPGHVAVPQKPCSSSCRCGHGWHTFSRGKAARCG